MGYSYKTYSDTKDVMKKYVNATEGAIIYSIGKTRLDCYCNDPVWNEYETERAKSCSGQCFTGYR